MDPTDSKIREDAELVGNAVTRLESLAYRLRHERDQARNVARCLAQCIRDSTEPPKNALGRSYVRVALAFPAQASDSKITP